MSKVETITIPGGYTNEVIGTVTVTEPSAPRTEHHTYYAADYRTYVILPGEYEARLVRRGDTVSQGYVAVTVDIKIIEETLHSGFAGVNFASERNDTVRKSTKTIEVYDYEAADRAGQREPSLAGGAFRLAPEWAVVTRHNILSNGEHYTSRKFAKIS
jgi:hypothetical protein